MRGTYDTPKRSHVIKTRLDDEEYKFFLLKCKAYGMNQSEMIRTSLDKLVINPVIKFSPVNKELLSKIDELITEGKRIGNNLNQIARALNSGFPDQSIESEIRRALGDLAEWKYEILQEVGSAIGNDQTFELEKLGPRGRRALLDLSEEIQKLSRKNRSRSRINVLKLYAFETRNNGVFHLFRVSFYLPNQTPFLLILHN